MPNQYIQRAKRRVDIWDIEVSFADLLEAGETITSVSVLVSIFTGEDPDPTHILDGSPTVTGTLVEQTVKLGVPGVIYQLVFLATTDQDNVYERECRLAIRPNPYLYLTTFLTTTVYPIQFRDDFVGASEDLSGALLYKFPLDHLDTVPEPIVSGQLRPMIQAYDNWPPEAIDTLSGALQSGELRQILKSYNDWPPEGVDSAGAIQSGELKDILIQYSNWPAEGLDCVGGILSGTLV